MHVLSLNSSWDSSNGAIYSMPKASFPGIFGSDLFALRLSRLHYSLCCKCLSETQPVLWVYNTNQMTFSHQCFT